MAKELQVRRGAVLLWRLGNLKYGEQSRWARAPEPKGLWAFPWPYFETFLTAHQYQDLLPKRLRTYERSRWPLDPSWYVHDDGSAVDHVEREEDGWPADSKISVRPEFYEEKNQWISTVATRILPIRKFWYEGDVYAHINRRGEIGNTGTFGGGGTDWHRMDVTDFAKAVRKSRGDRMLMRLGSELITCGSTVDHLEIFLPFKGGSIRGGKHE